MWPSMTLTRGKRSKTPPNSRRSAWLAVSTCQPQVAPAAGHPVAHVFGGNVESADDGNRLIGNKQLAVVATAVAGADVERVEPAEFASGLNKWIPETAGQRNGAKGINKHLHAYPPFPCPDELVQKAEADFVCLENIHLQNDAAAGGLNGGKHRFQPRCGVGEQTKGIRFGGKKRRHSNVTVIALPGHGKGAKKGEPP